MLSYKTQTPEVYMQKIRRNKGIEKTEVNCIIPFQMSKIRNAQISDGKGKIPTI
jgi:hypothetical protein